MRKRAGWLRGSSNLFLVTQPRRRGTCLFTGCKRFTHRADRGRIFRRKYVRDAARGAILYRIAGVGGGEFRCIFTRNIFAELSRGFLNN